MRKLTLGLLKAAVGRFLVEGVGPDCQACPESTGEEALARRLRHDFRRFVAASLSVGDTELGSPGDDGVAFPSIVTDFRVAPGSRLRLGDGRIAGHHKVRGLDYSLLILVPAPMAQLSKAIFIDQSRTADFQTTLGIRDIMRRNGNLDDLVAFLEERCIGLDDDDRLTAAGGIVSAPPRLGYLTYSLGPIPCIRFGHALEVLRTEKPNGIELIRPECRVLV